MSQFFDQASLVMVPSGYKDGKVYSQKPLSTDGELTFSRGSDIEATRVASNGYIEKAKVNLLLRSNSFDTIWGATSVSVTGGQAGYDGTNNAWLIDITAGTSSQRVNQTISESGVLTFSVYAKAGTLNWISLRGDAPAVSEAYFNLATGALGNLAGAGIDSSIESVGSGWYRCSVSFVDTTIVRIYLATDDNDVSQSSGNVYIQDAQLNYGLVAQEYQETTTTSVVSGITNDMPRLDYSGGASCPSLLLEPSRQNYATQSEYIGAWAQSATIGTDNFAVSPEGVQNASKVSASLTSATHFIQLTGGAVGNTATISLFAKADTGSYIQLTNPYSGGIFANFDVATGVVGTKGASCISSDIEDYGNGYYRCIAVFDNTGFNSNIYRHYIVPSASAAFGLSWLPASDTSLFIYGHSWEAGSYSTSYIPTYGTSASRTQDAASKTGISSLIGQTEGTALLDFQYNGAQESIIMDIAASGLSPQDRIILYQPSGGFVQFIIFENNVQQVSIASSSYAIGERLKVGIAYKTNDFAFYINGVQIGTDNSGSVPATSRIDIGNRQDGTYPAPISVNQTLLFTTRLSNADLATLTTL